MPIKERADAELPGHGLALELELEMAGVKHRGTWQGQGLLLNPFLAAAEM